MALGHHPPVLLFLMSCGGLQRFIAILFPISSCGLPLKHNLIVWEGVSLFFHSSFWFQHRTLGNPFIHLTRLIYFESSLLLLIFYSSIVSAPCDGKSRRQTSLKGQPLPHTFLTTQRGLGPMNLISLSFSSTLSPSYSLEREQDWISFDVLFPLSYRLTESVVVNFEATVRFFHLVLFSSQDALPRTAEKGRR